MLNILNNINFLIFKKEKGNIMIRVYSIKTNLQFHYIFT
jgi:hypothetical protein